MKIRLTLLTLSCALYGSCTSVDVKRVQYSNNPIKLVYIQQNPDVAVDELLSVIENGFQRRGIQTKIIINEKVPESAYVLTYTASRGWDFTPYLKHAELRLKEGNRLVGYAVYHHRGGFGLNKWASTESKMTPVVNELLAGLH